MARTKTKDITDRFKRMRKCKIVELLTSPEIDLTPEEMNVFLLRLTNSNDGFYSQNTAMLTGFNTLGQEINNKRFASQ